MDSLNNIAAILGIIVAFFTLYKERSYIQEYFQRIKAHFVSANSLSTQVPTGNPILFIFLISFILPPFFGGFIYFLSLLCDFIFDAISTILNNPELAKNLNNLFFAIDDRQIEKPIWLDALILLSGFFAVSFLMSLDKSNDDYSIKSILLSSPFVLAVSFLLVYSHQYLEISYPNVWIFCGFFMLSTLTLIVINAVFFLILPFFDKWT